MTTTMLEAVTKEAILGIKDDIMTLYKQELYAKQLYLGQIRKLEGTIVEVLKELSAQEEVHAQTLKIMLHKADIATQDEYEKIPRSKLNEPLANAIEIDILAEESATKAYTSAIAKSTDEAMRLILSKILNEEVKHVEILKRYFASHKNLME